MSSAGPEEDGFTPVLSAAEKKKQRKQAREQEQKRPRDQGRQKGSNAQAQSQAQPPRGAAQTPLNMQPIKAQITVPPSAGPSPPAARPSSQSSPAPPSPAPPVRPPKPDHGAPVPAGLRSPTSGPLSPTNDFFSNSGNLRHYALGRAPWYNESGQKKPFIIGITGGTASGKTTICHKVVEALGMPWVIELSMDRFYRPLTKDQMANVKDYNFDHPEAFDWDLLLHTLRLLRDGKKVEVPIYSFKSHSREKETDTLYGADVIIFEGIFALFDPRVRTFLDLKVFVDTDSDTRLARRLTRDIVERGRTVEGVLAQYTKTVKPSYDEYIAPTKRFADLIIPWTGGEASLGPPTLMVQQREEVPVHQLKSVAVDLMVEHIKAQLVNRGVEFQQGILQQQYHPGVFRAGAYNMSVLPRNVAVLERTVNLRQLHTVLRDRDTEQEDFQEAVHRVSRLTLARAMDLVPDVCSPVTVRTPTDNTFTAQRFDMSKLCGVAIVRGGKPLQGCLKHMAPDASMGDIVIQQSGNKTEGPRLYYSKLPDQISSGRVILMDALVSTANNVVMAVHVLLDHGVKEDNIVLVTLVSTPQGLMALSKRFPAMQIVTSWVDEGLDGHLFVSPGLGAFGDRYYGDHSALSLSLSSVPELATPSRR